jgi:hypothetical protein
MKTRKTKTEKLVPVVSIDPVSKGISRRQILKNVVWIPFIGSSFLAAAKNGKTEQSAMNGTAPISVEELGLMPPDNWYKFCRPILEWINPHQNIDCVAYVERLIKNAKDANVNTVYFVIDHGGIPLYQGSIEPTDPIIGDFDLLGYLEKRVHEEGMYFVAAQFGQHTLSALGERHPDWLQRGNKGEEYIGPGSVPLMCSNTGYGDYVAEELSRIVGKYKIDGIYIEGLHNPVRICYCKSCKEKFMLEKNKPLPEIALKTDMEIARFNMDSIIGFIDNVNRKVKKVSPKTILMACPSVNRPSTHRVDWKKLSTACDVVALELMWGNRNVYPLWQIGMCVGVMQAESRKTCFSTAWYAIHVDREYTPRTRATLQLNYFESIFNGGTVQFHTQNALEEAPDNIPVLKELYSYTEKIRPYFFFNERINYVSILYDRDYLMPEEHFAGYYKALRYKHIPFKIISRDDLNSENMKDTRVLILPNIVRLTDAEISFINDFTNGGGTLIATHKTGFQSADAKSSAIARLLGIRSFNGEKIASIKAGENWSPEVFRVEQNHYFRCVKGTFADEATGISLLTFSGSQLLIEPADDTKVLANTLSIDKSRQSPGNPILYGYYPGEINSPLILERKEGKGRVIYFSGELDKAFYEQGYDFLSEILVKAIGAEALPLYAVAPSTVSITYYKLEKEKGLLIHLLNGTTNQSLAADPVNTIFPVQDIKINLKGYKKAFSLNGTEIKTTINNGYLTLTIPELKVIDTILVT